MKTKVYPQILYYNNGKKQIKLKKITGMNKKISITLPFLLIKQSRQQQNRTTSNKIWKKSLSKSVDRDQVSSLQILMTTGHRQGVKYLFKTIKNNTFYKTR